MSWLRYGWGNVQPQSTMVESLASSKEMPKQTQWYHSKQVRHCTISLRLECWVLNPRQNTHKKASNAPHFHGRRGHMWLKGVSLSCKCQPDDVKRPLFIGQLSNMIENHVHKKSLCNYQKWSKDFGFCKQSMKQMKLMKRNELTWMAVGV